MCLCVDALLASECVQSVGVCACVCMNVQVLRESVCMTWECECTCVRYHHLNVCELFACMYECI